MASQESKSHPSARRNAVSDAPAKNVIIHEAPANSPQAQLAGKLYEVGKTANRPKGLKIDPDFAGEIYREVQENKNKPPVTDPADREDLLTPPGLKGKSYSIVKDGMKMIKQCHSQLELSYIEP